MYGQNVDYGKSIIFEFGIQHAFSDDMVLDISAYNRDNLANAAGRLVSAFDPLTQPNEDLRLITNSDFGNTKGLDLRLNRRFGQLFNGTIGYSYTSAQNTGTDPFTYINFGSRVVNQVTGGNQPPPQAIAPVALSRPHNLVGSLAPHLPERVERRLDDGLDPAELPASSRLPVRQRHGVHRRAANAAGNEAVLSGQVCNRGGFTGGLNSAAPADVQAVRHALREGLQPRPAARCPLYLDARNILGFTNTLTQYVTTNSITSQIEQQQNFTADSTRYASRSRWRTASSTRTTAHRPHVRRRRRERLRRLGQLGQRCHRCRTAST